MRMTMTMKKMNKHNRQVLFSTIPSSPVDNVPSEERMSNEEEEVESGGGRREYDDAN
jgi:hypothetical protein